MSNDKTAKITSKKLVDSATGQPTDETTVTVPGEGTYKIDPTTGAVTFTPEPDFVGTAKGVKVQATATITNGKGETSTITAEASYTPTVKSAAPTAKTQLHLKISKVRLKQYTKICRYNCFC